MQKLQVGSKVIVFMFILIMEMASLTIQIRMHFQTTLGLIVLVEKHMILQYIKEKV